MSPPPTLSSLTLETRRATRPLRELPLRLVLGLGWLSTRLPYPLAMRLGRGLGRIWMLAAWRRRPLAEANLAACLPELPAVAREELLERHFAAMGMGLIETAWAWWAPGPRLQALVSIEGIEHLRSALDRGHGALLVSAPLTCLGLAGRLLSLYEPFHLLYRSHPNPLLEGVLRAARSRHFASASPQGDLRGLLKALREGRPVWLSPDQDPGGGDAPFLRLLGQPAATSTAPVRLARLAGAPLLPLSVERRPGGGGYRLGIGPALAGFPGEDALADTQRLNGLLEAEVRRAPAEYLWARRRFQTRPAVLPGLYDRRVIDARRVLLITLSNIGDAVMTTPVLEALHLAYPQARLDLVADARSAELFAHCPYRGELILKAKGGGWRGLAGLLRRLRRTRYDLVVDLRTDGLAYLLRAGARLTRWQARPRGPHAVERHIGVLEPGLPLGAEIPPQRLWLADAERARADELTAGLPAGRWLALAPGANWGPKTWPAECFRELLGLLAEDFAALVLLGGPRDRALNAGLAQASPLPCVDLAGRTTLLEAAAVLERCVVFVGNDSGLGHIAAAMGVPPVTVFGPGEPERYRPWHPRGQTVTGASGRIADVPPRAVAEAVWRLNLVDLPVA